MMKLMIGLMFLMFLSFKNMFWLIQWFFFFFTFHYMMNFAMDWNYLNLSYFMGSDLLSFLMVMLSLWICSLMILASGMIKINKNFSNFFLFVMISLLIILCMIFLSLNLFIFYLFFEISLIPILILILGWGYQLERLQAGIYLLFYTLMASLPMMIAIFYLYSEGFNLEFSLMNKDLQNYFLFICMNLVFLIKIPMFLLHLWLPKAHVEAPVSGSMILAGVMLKMGGYGLLRLLKFYMILFSKFSCVMLSISLMGGLIISLICMRQSDMKSLIAYSSVVHMGLMLGGLMTLNYWGICASLSMMIAHGLCSSGLFCLVNINYERFMSRSLYMNKGLINLFPSLSLWWFLLVSSNMASPPSLNLMSEIMLINSILYYNFMNLGMLMFISFFSAVYSIYLFSFSQHGQFYSGMFGLSYVKLREFFLLFFHWCPLNLLFLKGSLVCLWV